MAKNEKRGEEGSTKFENLADKGNICGKMKSFLIIFLKFYFGDKNKNSAHKF